MMKYIWNKIFKYFFFIIIKKYRKSEIRMLELENFVKRCVVIDFGLNRIIVFNKLGIVIMLYKVFYYFIVENFICFIKYIRFDYSISYK